MEETNIPEPKIVDGVLDEEVSDDTIIDEAMDEGKIDPEAEPVVV